MNRLVIIDGLALVHRAYHALPPLTTSKGIPVNAVYGFINILIKVLDDLKPEYLVTTFDKKTPTFRHIEYKGYKAKRPPTDEELKIQIPLVKKIVEVMGIPFFELDGYEADDLIGTIINKVLKEKTTIDEIFIVTGDRDTLQLVDSKVKVYTTRQKMSEVIVYDEALIMEKYGLNPKQIVDLKALAGDPSDNIPGVKGIGEKTAEQLIREFGSLENIYRSIEKINGATKEKLINGKEDAILSYKLATIVKDAPLDLSLSDLRYSFLEDPEDRAKTKQFLEELEFRSLLKKIFKESLNNNEEESIEKNKNEQLTFI